MPIKPNEITKAAKLIKNTQATKSLSPRSHYSNQPVNLEKYQQAFIPKGKLVEKLNNIATSLIDRSAQVADKLASSKIYTAHKSRLAKNAQAQITK